MDLDDNEIIIGILEGDEDSFIQLVDKYKKRIVGLCYSYSNDYQEAEDLSQEVFISIYKNIRNFRREASLSTYIYKIAVSRCLDYKRKRSIKSFLNGLFNVQEEQTYDLDERTHIRQCIKKLPEKLKTPVILYYYAGLSQKEIAEIIDIPVKTVEGRIYRAKQKLRGELEGGEVVCSKKETI